ncbi:MAG TPA: hypothetical protein VLD84_00660 [Nitrososphaeraceae archaeon]|nr:hypothetical protein [Nitrososphaeraceae archaeon]
MKAAVYREHSKDPRQVVRIEDIDIPKPKSNSVLIKVEAASYNYNDLWGIWGANQSRFQCLIYREATQQEKL